MTHKPIALKFWVRAWRLSCLCGCSSLDVDAPPSSPHDPTVVSEPGSTKGTTEAAGPLGETSNGGAVSVSEPGLTKGTTEATSPLGETSNGGAVSVRCGETSNNDTSK